MLDERVSRFVQDAVRVKSHEFDQDLLVRFAQADSTAVAAGQFNGTGRINHYMQLCRQELRNRAQYIFLEIQRALGLYPQLLADALKKELVRLLTIELHNQCAVVQRLLHQGLGLSKVPNIATAPGGLNTQLGDELRHLNEKYTLEMGAFIQTATQRSEAVNREDRSVVIHGPVGVLQTGDYSTSTMTVNLGAGDREAMSKALDIAANTLANSQHLAAEHRREMLEVVDHLREAISQQRPNQSFIRGMFTVLCSTLQTLASCEPAMNALRAAALPFGIVL